MGKLIHRLVAAGLAACLAAEPATGAGLSAEDSGLRNFPNTISQSSVLATQYFLFGSQALEEGVLQMKAPLPDSHVTARFDRTTENLRTPDQTLSFSVRGKTYSFRKRVLDTGLFKHIELHLLDQPPEQIDADLFIYAMKTSLEGWGLHGVFITPELRNLGLTKPLINLFFQCFPEIRAVHRVFSQPLIRALLLRDYGFGPEEASAPLLYLGPKNYNRSTLYFTDIADVQTFRSWASDRVQEQYQNLRVGKPPSGAIPVPMVTRLILPDSYGERVESSGRRISSMIAVALAAGAALAGWVAFGPGLTHWLQSGIHFRGGTFFADVMPFLFLFPQRLLQDHQAATSDEWGWLVSFAFLIGTTILRQAPPLAGRRLLAWIMRRRKQRPADNLGGNFIGPKVTPNEEVAWRGEIAKESDEVRELNRDTIDLAVKRADRLMERESEIRDMLKREGVRSEQINVAIDALRHLAQSFQWFDAIDEGPGKYMLGNESALAVNFIRYLNDKEATLGAIDLVDEYLLHEALERTRPGHRRILALTRLFFRREEENPLDGAIKSWLEWENRSYPPRLSDRLIDGILDSIGDFQAKLKAARTKVKKAQLWLRHRDIELADNELTFEKFSEILLGPLMREFEEYGDDAVGTLHADVVIKALIELDRARAKRFFMDFLLDSNADLRLSAELTLRSLLRWKPRKPEDRANLLMASQAWEELETLAGEYPKQVLSVLRVAVLGSGLNRVSDEVPFAHEAAARLLVKLGPAAEQTLVEAIHMMEPGLTTLGLGFQDLESAYDLLDILKTMPQPGELTISALETKVTEALKKDDQEFLTELGRTLQILRAKRAA